MASFALRHPLPGLRTKNREDVSLFQRLGHDLTARPTHCPEYQLIHVLLFLAAVRSVCLYSEMKSRSPNRFR